MGNERSFMENESGSFKKLLIFIVLCVQTTVAAGCASGGSGAGERGGGRSRRPKGPPCKSPFAVARKGFKTNPPFSFLFFLTETALLHTVVCHVLASDATTVIL